MTHFKKQQVHQTMPFLRHFYQYKAVTGHTHVKINGTVLRRDVGDRIVYRV